jgi:hypothetical protein
MFSQFWGGFVVGVCACVAASGAFVLLMARYFAPIEEAERRLLRERRERRNQP